MRTFRSVVSFLALIGNETAYIERAEEEAKTVTAWV